MKETEPLKQIKLKPSVHKRLAKFCGKGRTYNQAILDLLIEPFIMQKIANNLRTLEDELQFCKEKGRHARTVADKAIRILNEISDCLYDRSPKEWDALFLSDEQVEELKKIHERMRVYIVSSKKKIEIEGEDVPIDEEDIKITEEIANDLEKVCKRNPKSYWSKYNKRMEREK